MKAQVDHKDEHKSTVLQYIRPRRKLANVSLFLIPLSIKFWTKISRTPMPNSSFQQPHHRDLSPPNAFPKLPPRLGICTPSNKNSPCAKPNFNLFSMVFAELPFLGDVKDASSRGGVAMWGSGRVKTGTGGKKKIRGSLAELEWKFGL